MSIRVTDPAEIARLEARIVGRKSPTRPAQPPSLPETRSKPRLPQAEAPARRADPIRVDDRLGISPESVEAAVRRIAPTLEPRFRSKLEARFALQLKCRCACGELARWWYEPVTFRLPGGHWYTPDFVLELPDGRLEWVETKGYLWKHDALKIDAFREIWRGLAYRIEKKI